MVNFAQESAGAVHDSNLSINQATKDHGNEVRHAKLHVQPGQILDVPA